MPPKGEATMKMFTFIFIVSIFHFIVKFQCRNDHKVALYASELAANSILEAYENDLVVNN